MLIGRDRQVASQTAAIIAGRTADRPGRRTARRLASPAALTKINAETTRPDHYSLREWPC
jgi:hypothetical protein